MSAATQREDRCLVKPAKLKGLAARKFADLLMALGFVKALKAKTGMPAPLATDRENRLGGGMRGTEYGIEQEFNPLDNQREAFEAYVSSHRRSDSSDVAQVQSRILGAAHAAPYLSSALISTAYNVGIATGAWVGGLWINNGFGYQCLPIVSFIASSLAVGIAAFSWALDRQDHIHAKA